MDFCDEDVSPFQESLLKGPIAKIQQILGQIHDAKLSQGDNINKCKEIVEIALELKIDVNLPKSKYSALLHFVAKKLDEETFKSVLSRISKDFNINALYKGKALLHYLSDKGNENFVKYLLEFGADVNLKDNVGETALFYAVSKNYPRVVRLLLNYGAKIHDKQFPLRKFFIPYEVVFNIEIIKMLLEAGYDVSPKNNEMLLFYEIFEDETWDPFNSFFFDDNNCQNWEIVKLLCAHGAEICLKNELGTNILHYFCRTGLLDDVRFSVKYGADLFSIENGYTTLHEAVSGNNFDLMDFLLCNGVDINNTGQTGEPPIVTISSKLLLFTEVRERYRGAEPMDRDQKGKEFIEMINFLVGNGANVNVFDDNFISQMQESIYKNSLKIPANSLALNANFEHRGEKIKSTRTVGIELLTAFFAMKENDISQLFNDVANRTEFKWIVEPFFRKCKTEINEMKRRNICQEKNISFFDFLSKDLMEVAVFCSCSEIMHILKSGEYKKEFPFYEYLLGRRIETVQLLRNSINCFTHFIEKNFNTKLPIIVLNVILSYLRAGDLRNFAKTLRISKDFPNGKY